MLVHIDQVEVAERVHNAWLRTMEDGVHTYDIYKEDVSKQKVGTKEFGEAVVARLGQKPETLKAVHYASAPTTKATARKEVTRAAVESKLEGIDVYVGWPSRVPNELAAIAVKANGDGLDLTMMDNRGTKVWPDGFAETWCSDSFRCRYTSKGAVTVQHTLDLQSRLDKLGVQIVKSELLRSYGGGGGGETAAGGKERG